MSYLSAVVGVKDASGNRIDAKRADGTRAPVMIKLGGGLTGASAENGGLTEVTLTAAQKLLVDGTEVTPGSATWNLIGASAEYDAVNDRINIHVGGGGLDWQESVRVATAAPLPANTRTDNVLTADANGSINAAGIDGVTDLAVGQRVLVKDEATAANNGLYRVTDLGDGSTPWSLERVPTADLTGEVTNGMTTFVGEGSQAGTFWTLTTNDPITLNTDALTFTQNLAGSGVSGLGVAGRLTRWSTPTAIEESVATDDGAGNLGAVSLAVGSPATPADAGGLRLASTSFLRFRKQADDGNVDGLTKTSGDVIQVGGVNATGVQLRVGANPVFEGVAAKLTAHQAIELEPGAGPVATSGHLRARKGTTILTAADAAGTGEHELLRTDDADTLFVGASTLASVTVANGVLKLGTGGLADSGTINGDLEFSASARNDANDGDISIFARESGDDLEFGGARAGSRPNIITIDPENDFRVRRSGALLMQVNNSHVVTYGRFKARFATSDTANTGAIGLRNTAANGGVYFRDAANSADILGIAVDASDNLLLGDSNVTLTDVASPLAVGSASGAVASTGTLRGPNGFNIFARDVANTLNARLLDFGASDILGIGGTGVASMNIDINTGNVLRLVSNQVLVNVSNLRWQASATPTILQFSTSSTTAADMSITAQSSTATTGATQAGSVIIGGGDATAGSDTVLFKGGDVELVGGEAANAGGFGSSARGGTVYLTAGTGQVGEAGGHGSVILRGQNESTVLAVGNDAIAFFGGSTVGQQSTTGTTSGFTAGSGTGANDDSTYDGGLGGSAYTTGDVVRALKRYGLLAA